MNRFLRSWLSLACNPKGEDQNSLKSKISFCIKILKELLKSFRMISHTLEFHLTIVMVNGHGYETKSNLALVYGYLTEL